MINLKFKTYYGDYTLYREMDIYYENTFYSRYYLTRRAIKLQLY